jgi:predicted transglutaminase-like cysteine proteinase
MPALHRMRNTAAATTWVAVLTFAVAVAAGDALAKPVTKKQVEPAALSDVRPPAPGPARFFTINEILQKRDNAAAGSGGRTASVEQPAANDATQSQRRGAPGPEPFGLYAFRAPDGLLWSKWHGIESDLLVEAKETSDCRDRKICSEAATRYLVMLEETRGRTGRAQIETANRLVNSAIRYVSDQQQHGISDRWQAPLAAFAAGRGDCEEYAIAKYILLRESGMAEADLRLVLVRDTSIRVDHAVLAARFEGRWLVLDNRRSMAAETEDLRHYTPLYALDKEGVKLFAAPYAVWGERDVELSSWTLRGSDFAEWTLRGSDAEPAGAQF